MTKTVHGIVRGRTIEVSEDLGVAEGQEVEVSVRTLHKSTRKPGDGFLRTEGALADDTEWDAIMDEIHQTRRLQGRSYIADQRGEQKMSISITVEEAQAKLKDLIHGLAPGEELVITENQKAVARLVSEPVKVTRPPPGLGKGGIIFMAPDFGAPIEDMKDYME